MVHANLFGQRGTAAFVYVVLVGEVLQRGTAAVLASCPFEPLVSGKKILVIMMGFAQSIPELSLDVVAALHE
jgi:hypothetical protein